VTSSTIRSASRSSLWGSASPEPDDPATREPLLGLLPDLEVTLVLGQYAQAYHFGDTHPSLTELVRSWRDYWPSQVPLPHPSPRNNIWLRRNPWFAAELLPALRTRVSEVLP
jgi:uracil-DNA glycosylase